MPNSYKTRFPKHHCVPLQSEVLRVAGLASESICVQLQVQELQAQNSQLYNFSDGQDVESIRESIRLETAESMNDLLVCLGLENEKVLCLAQRLELLGEDVTKILNGVGRIDIGLTTES